MSRLLARYWLLVPLILGALLVRDWVEEPETLAPVEPLEIQRRRADYYLEDFVTRRFDASGALEYLVAGDTLSHYPEDDRAEIERPRLELRRDGASWRARAETGALVRAPDVVTLAGDVLLERDADASPVPGADVPANEPADGPVDGPALPDRLEIRADDLSVRIDSNEIFTDGPVEIVAPGWRLGSVGLRSAIDAGKLELRSAVTGRYEVASP